MKSVIKNTFIALAVLASTSMTVCHAEKIGISMPNLTTPRWKTEGEYLKKMLEDQGHSVILQIADNTTQKQISDLEQMVAENCDFLIISSIDGKVLNEVLTKAKAKGAHIIAYDRMIMNTDAVDYYATYDNYAVGTLQGKYIVDNLHLNSVSPGEPKYIELFAGSITDANAHFVYDGNMTILKKYFDEGKLIIRSNQNKLEEIAVPHWLGEKAKIRMRQLVADNNYGPSENQNKLDAILSPSDGVSTGIIEYLVKEAGYKKTNIPLITGQDCSIPAAKNIRRGLQAMCVFKDSRVLAYQVAEMIKSIINHTDVDVNDTSTYDNGKKVVPTYLCSPVVIDKNNLKEVLVESGYYSAKDLK